MGKTEQEMTPETVQIVIHGNLRPVFDEWLVDRRLRLTPLAAGGMDLPTFGVVMNR